ncbi:MAG: BMP family ABC transporter substrate-binding protein [Leptospirales bacterium]|nr:BMP family ABC transporter substrate-binding protein [Leptospirales bacterium]
MKKSKIVLIARSAVILCTFLLVLGCEKQDVWRPGKPVEKDKIKIGVIYPNRIEEKSGYDYSHYVGITEMQREIGLRDDQIIHKTNIYEADPGTTINAIRDCIKDGANIIIAASWGYMDACEKLASKYPHVVFVHVTGHKSNRTNFSNCTGKTYQARYLSGIAAGLKTKTGKIGYVAAMGKENSEVTAGINAFALGVEKANPKARIHVNLTHSWFDPMGEEMTAKRLIASGCDVIAQHCNTAKPQVAAQDAGVWGIGYNSDMSKDAPKAVITSVIIRWGVAYTNIVRSVIDGTFTTVPYVGSIEDGMVGITPVSERLAAPGTDKKIAEERERILSGSFNIFEGVIETNDGKHVGEAGKPFPEDKIYLSDWYYRTVVEE